MNNVCRFKFNLIRCGAGCDNPEPLEQVEVTTECIPLNSAHTKARGLEKLAHDGVEPELEPAKRYISTGRSGPDLSKVFDYD